MKSVPRGARCLWRIGLEKKKFSGWKTRMNDGAMDDKSGDDDTQEVR